jgi:hypothetical protein
MAAASNEQLRGDAAWRAAKQAIADRNDAAYERREIANLPKQPGT